jgi:hypothetical protein
MSPTKVKRRVDLGIATIIAAVIGAIALTGGGFLGRTTASTGSPSPAPTVTRTIAPTLQAVHLGFSLSSTASVPWCNTLDGTGPIPEGDSLLIFDSPLGPNGQPLAQTRYYFDGPAARTSNDAWSITPVYIGNQNDTGIYVAVDGILVSDQTASFIESLVAEPIDPINAKVTWKSKVLPPGLAHIHLTVLRNAIIRQCAS